MKSIYLTIGLLTLWCLAASSKTPKEKQAKTDNIATVERIQEIKDSLNSIMEKAKSGDASAMNEVGTWYYTGKHVNQDYGQAYEWWKKASLKSNIRAIANLGMCYQLGHGVEKDSIDALRLYEKSIKEGNKALFTQRVAVADKSPFDAMLIGHCYEEGIGVKKDYSKAAEFYAKAASMGSITGKLQAGLCYLNVKNPEKAIEYLEKGASQGNHACEYWAGKILLGDMGMSANKQQAIVYLLNSAEGGMPAAQAEMGQLYSEGNGVTKNTQQSTDWFRKAALQGNPKGMWNYGMALKDGKGVKQDYDQALFWMAESGQVGYQRAFKKMLVSLDSIGSEPFVNYVRGMKMYLIDGKMKEASEQFKKIEKAKIDEGKIMQAVVLASKRNDKSDAKKAIKELERFTPMNPEATFYLATLYETGNGTDPNMPKAIELYRISADMGYGKAQSYLGDIFYEGRGTDKDLNAAVDMYIKALGNRQLSQNGATRLAECYENGLGGLSADKKKADQLRKENFQDNVFNMLKTINL